MTNSHPSQGPRRSSLIKQRRHDLNGPAYDRWINSMYGRFLLIVVIGVVSQMTGDFNSASAQSRAHSNWIFGAGCTLSWDENNQMRGIDTLG